MNPAFFGVDVVGEGMNVLAVAVVV